MPSDEGLRGRLDRELMILQIASQDATPAEAIRIRQNAARAITALAAAPTTCPECGCNILEPTEDGGFQCGYCRALLAARPAARRVPGSWDCPECGARNGRGMASCDGEPEEPHPPAARPAAEERPWCQICGRETPVYCGGCHDALAPEREP
jgi:hypothetical protein